MDNFILNEQKIRIDKLNVSNQKNVQIDLLRLDLIDKEISGNKWFKLKYNLRHVIENSFSSILTFGGAYSNHLVATAAATKQYNINSIGIVRGLYHKKNLSHTLAQCLAHNMQLHFVEHAQYALKNDASFLNSLKEKFGNIFIIPEGGANEYGRKGAEEIVKYIPLYYTHICIAAGTGTTFAGLRNTLPPEQKIIGFAPMKQGKYLEKEIKSWLSEKQNHNWEIIDRFHFGGFGKINEVLQNFMNQFYIEHGIELDRIYTGKMMYGILQFVKEGFFSGNARVLCVHTGGLQGNNS